MYLRLPRFIFFGLTMALSITVVGLSSWALKTGIDKKHLVANSIPGASLDISDALGSGGALVAASGVASLLCLGMVYMAIYRRHQVETIKSVRIKEGLFSFACIFWIATLIPATIIFAKRSGVVSKPGVPASVITGIVSLSGQKLAYVDQTPIRSYVVVGWIAFASTVINLILVSITARHVLKNGPSTRAGGKSAALTEEEIDRQTTHNDSPTMNTHAEKVAAAEETV